METCRQLRERGFTKPIIMLTAQNVENDMAVALETDANDYIVKPMRMGELLARGSLAALASQGLGYDKVFNFWPQLCSANKLLKSADDTKVILTEKEATILKYLYRSHPSWRHERSC